jgi:hypothetical protein
MLRLVSKSARSSERHQLRGFGYFKRTGPGFITGAADDDPAGIGTSNSSVAGRQKGGAASNALVAVAFVVMSAFAAWYLIELL